MTIDCTMMKHAKRVTGLVSLLLVMSLSTGSAIAENWPRFPRGDFPLTDTTLMVDGLQPDEFMTGGPPRDGIPAIDKPLFVSFEAANQWLADDEPVVAFDIDGEARAYPLQIMMYHEIVNDTVAGQPVSITFCPLCNASIVFDRRTSTLASAGNEPVDDAVLDFGTTGRLRLSDLVMYDRQTETWWQQFSGRALVGTLAGASLARLPSAIVSYAAFKQSWHGGEVLSRDTGYQRPYGRNPYSGYDRIDSNPFLFRGELDPRLPPMERVLAIDTGSNRHLVTLTSLVDVDTRALELDGRSLVVFSVDNARSALDAERINGSRLVPSAAAYDASHNGDILSFDSQNGTITDTDTGSTWDMFGRAVSGPLKGARLNVVDEGVHFAFAWLAFDPDAHIVK